MWVDPAGSSSLLPINTSSGPGPIPLTFCLLTGTINRNPLVDVLLVVLNQGPVIFSRGEKYFLKIDCLQINLLDWWSVNKRQFPWRDTTNPYKILIAEILLHRTRAEQVLPVYCQFIKEFTSLESIASSDINRVLNLLTPLGLTWRSKALHKMAVEIMSKYDGKVPESLADLLSLTGIGPYIASAVRCFAYGYSEAVIDTNTVRIAGRLLNIKVTDGSRRSRLFKDTLQHLLDNENPKDFNLALIDLGASVCRPSMPDCVRCPIKSYCAFYQDSRESNV